MAAGDDMTDWAPGQPPPWLAAYGPVDSIPAAIAQPPGPPVGPTGQPGLGIPAAAIDNAAAVQRTQPGLPSSAPVPPPFVPVVPGAPGAPPAPQPGTPAHVAPEQAAAAPMDPPWLHGPPDAVSGVNERAPASALAATQQQHREGQDRTLAVVTDPNAPIATRMAAWQRLDPEQRTNLVNSADPKQLAAIATSAMAPEDLATIGIRHQQQQIHEQSVAALELARKADEDAQRAHVMQQMAAQQTTAALAQVDADSKALAMEKVDPAEHGVGHFIASVITSALGGAMSQYSGGRNLALEELDKQTQRRIDAQKSNIANKWQGLNFKRNLITEQYQRGADEARADATYRISQYDRAIGELQTKMQDYDQQGTTALRGAVNIQQIQGQRAQALQQFGQQDFNNRIKAAEVDMKARKDAQEAADKRIQQQEEIRAHKAGEALTGWGHALTARGQDMADARAKEAHEDALAAKQDTKDAALTKDQTERSFAGVPVEVVDKDGNSTIAREPVLKNKNGTPVLAATKEEGTKLREQLNGTRRVVDAIDRLREIRRKSGWTSDLSKNEDWQAGKAEFHNIVLGLRSTEGLSRLSDADIKQYEGLMGELEDPTRWNGIEPGLKQARSIAERNMAHAFNAQPGNDVDFHIADPLSNAPPVDTSDDAALKSVLDDPGKISNERLLKEYGINSNEDWQNFSNAARKDWESTGGAGGQFVDPVTFRIQRNGGMLPSQAAYINNLSEVANSRSPGVDDKARKAAAARLSKIAEDADSEAVRAAAHRALISSETSSIPADPQ